MREIWKNRELPEHNLQQLIFQSNNCRELILSNPHLQQYIENEIIKMI
jgi:hypothetical protein